LPEAIDLYKEALGSDAGLFMAHVQMGKIYEQLKQWPDAVEHFQAAVATARMIQCLIGFRRDTTGSGRLAESESTLAQAMETNLEFTSPLHLGITLQQEGKTTEARAAFTRFVELAPSRYGTQITDARDRLALMQ